MLLKKTKAFTLAEVMVTLTVLGVLAAIMLPAVSKIRPNKNKSLFKKAYYVAERTIFEMVNDETLYPIGAASYGFDNTTAVAPWGTVYQNQSKFCQIFARKVNTASDTVYCDANHTTPAGGGNYRVPTFVTTDGIAWYMPFTLFPPSGGKPGQAAIYVDVNNDKKPNCTYNANNCKRPDIFTIFVESDGKVHVSGVKEEEYLGSNDSLR